MTKAKATTKKEAASKRKRVSQAERERQVMAVIDLIEGGSSENAACKKVGIDRNTFRMAGFRLGAANKYAKALAGMADVQVQRIEDTIDDLEKRKIDPQSARVIIDARKWLASKMLPKRYGDKVQMADADGEKLQAPQFVIVPVRAKDESA